MLSDEFGNLVPATEAHLEKLGPNDDWQVELQRTDDPKGRGWGTTTGQEIAFILPANLDPSEHMAYTESRLEARGYSFKRWKRALGGRKASWSLSRVAP
jgi:hypothetical protein